MAGAAAVYEAQVPARSEALELRGLAHRVLRWGPPSADPVLLLHGFLDCADTFQFLVDALPRDWSFVALDWRGFGGSGWNDAPYWFPDYLADLEALLERLGVDGAPPAAGRALRVIGHSMGGNVAALYAGIRPGRFRWLASLEGFGLRRTTPEDAPARYAEWLDQLREPVRQSRYESVAQLARVIGRRHARLPPAHAEFLARAWSRPQPDGGIELRADPWHRLANPVLYRREEAEACWRRVEVPVLLVCGTESEFHRRLGPDGSESYFGAIFRRFELANIPGAGHMMHHESPLAVARAITDWAARQA
ncbi:MAG: alpha/beta hydrolase [Steroidobacteraceae bacterium]|jgi:pimeloyl-ACP methyl ester carboxylesterase|nr:alpha/beta hydrolase [Steroidobacteraceae bacterium]